MDEKYVYKNNDVTDNIVDECGNISFHTDELIFTTFNPKLYKAAEPTKREYSRGVIQMGEKTINELIEMVLSSTLSSCHECVGGDITCETRLSTTLMKEELTHENIEYAKSYAKQLSSDKYDISILDDNQSSMLPMLMILVTPK